MRWDGDSQKGTAEKCWKEWAVSHLFLKYALTGRHIRICLTFRVTFIHKMLMSSGILVPIVVLSQLLSISQLRIHDMNVFIPKADFLNWYLATAEACSVLQSYCRHISRNRFGIIGALWCGAGSSSWKLVTLWSLKDRHGQQHHKGSMVCQESISHNITTSPAVSTIDTHRFILLFRPIYNPMIWV